jgi:hypothetical protein
MFARQLRVTALSAIFLAGAASTSFAQTSTSGFAPTDGGTTVSGGVVTLNSGFDGDGTSFENPNLNIAVKNGDTISFEYKGPCGGGAPRVFIQGGAFNTFDPDPNGSACGVPIGDGFFRVTQTITGITAGTAGATGIVNDNISSPSTVMVRNLIIAGTRVMLATSPRNANECKNGGFAAGGFRNQGECVSSFNRNK